MKISFILVKPAVPANVGAAARAMKTMGFSRMVLVNPCDHLSTEARMLAHASNEILENAEVFPTLKDALQDVDFVIGTTARRRTSRIDYHYVDKLPGLLYSKKKFADHVAVVFGSEESGLSNEDLALCNILSSVSMATKYPSLNLAQSIMVYAYQLSEFAGKKTTKAKREVNKNEWLALKEKSEMLLPLIGIKSDTLIYSRIMDRLALLGDTDIHLMHSVISRMDKTLQKKG